MSYNAGRIRVPGRVLLEVIIYWREVPETICQPWNVLVKAFVIFLIPQHGSGTSLHLVESSVGCDGWLCSWSYVGIYCQTDRHRSVHP